MIFLFLFVLIPVVELYFMIQVGDSIGAFNTVMLVVLTAIIGGFLVRVQGFSTMLRVREQMAQGQVPALEIIEGSILLLCGVMLLLPGFVTDAIGFLLLIPPVRRLFVIWLLKRKSILQNARGPVVYESEAHYERDIDGNIISRKSRRVIEAEDWKEDDK